MRKVRQSRLAQCEAGQASIEFALTITMTLLLIFALIDFSRAIYTGSILQWAAQDGAREAIVMIDSSASQSEIKEAVEAAVKERLVGLDPDAVEIAPPSWTGNVVEIQVSYPFKFVVPIVAQITGDGIEMSSSASMIAH